MTPAEKRALRAVADALSWIVARMPIEFVEEEDEANRLLNGVLDAVREAEQEDGSR